MNDQIPEGNTPSITSVTPVLPTSLTTVTSLSKYLALTLFVLLPFLGFWMGMEYRNMYTDNGQIQPEAPVIPEVEQDGELRFTGTVTPGGRDTCQMDGVCSIMVGEYEVIWAEGDGPGPRPVGSRDDALVVGDRVEVYGKRQDVRTVTLYGDAAYFLRHVTAVSTGTPPRLPGAGSSIDVPPESHSTQDCGVTNCHGLEVTCGDVSKPIMCTMMYQVGDGCRQYVTCEKRNGNCQPVVSEKYQVCKTCIETCQSTYAKSPIEMFACESTCIENT